MTTRVLLVQFDGSYKPRLKRGGAGVAAFLVEQQCMKLLDWQAVAIASCPDNIHAETIACEQATLLAAEWYAKLAPEGSITVIIQGDILPLIQFLNYTARLRYAGVQQHLLNIKQTALHQLPNHSFTYLPREGNAIADYLAGAGAEFLPPAAGIDTYSRSPLPTKLLSKANLYHIPLQQSLTLNEHPHIHYPPLAAYLQQHPTHRQDLVRYLAKHRAHAGAAGLKITYWRTSSDGKGRYYAQGPAAQRLPKELRTLLYGRTHTEIDVIGAFYEIIRRTALTLGTSEEAERPPPIPGVEQARHIIEQELLRQRPQAHAARSPSVFCISQSMQPSQLLQSMLQRNTTLTHSPSPPSLQLCIRLPPWSASISRTTRPRTGSTALHATATSSTLRALRLHTYLTL